MTSSTYIACTGGGCIVTLHTFPRACTLLTLHSLWYKTIFTMCIEPQNEYISSYNFQLIMVPKHSLTRNLIVIVLLRQNIPDLIHNYETVMSNKYMCMHLYSYTSTIISILMTCRNKQSKNITFIQVHINSCHPSIFCQLHVHIV